MTPDLDPAIDALRRCRSRTSPSRSALVALSGIDGSGKGFVAERLRRRLVEERTSVALVNVDGWLELPPVRFAEDEPGRHFYEHAIRFDALFADLLLPLRDRRSIRLLADFAEETAVDYRKELYAFDDVDVVLVEGIFLLKRELRRHYDLSLWVDGSFETALERAVSRAQEGLSPEATIRAYRTIYFPAQEIHLDRDAPREAATLVIDNDRRP